MIFFFENGRLGNQLFQYYGLKSYFPKHKLYFFGCSSLQNLFNKVDVKFIKLKKNIFLNELLKKTLFFFSEIRILSKINQTDNNKLKIQCGLLSNFYIAHNIFFQDNSHVKKIINRPIIKEKYLKYAKSWLKKKNFLNKNTNLVFVHIRRKDYFFWPDLNYSAVLNLSWYNKNILYIKKKIKNPFFVIMGDDTLYLQKFFKETKNLVISKNSYKVDFSIMSLCSHGILSPSTFAWWGAYYSKTYNKNNNYFIAPKYWAGHKLKKWFPKNFRTRWIIYVK
jgi:hypothetical protein